MKKIIPILMALILVFSMFTACSQTDKSAVTESTKDKDNTSQTNEITNNQDTDEISISNDEINMHPDIKNIFDKATALIASYTFGPISTTLQKDFGDYTKGDIIDSRDGTVALNPDPNLSTYYCETNLKYQQAVDKYSTIFSGKALDKFLSVYFYNHNGNLCFFDSDGICDGYSLTDVRIIYIGNNNNDSYYIANYNTEFTSDADGSVYYTPKFMKFTVTSTKNGNCISSPEFLYDFTFGPYNPYPDATEETAKKLFSKVAETQLLYNTHTANDALSSYFGTTHLDYNKKIKVNNREYIFTGIKYNDLCTDYTYQGFTGDALSSFMSRFFYDKSGMGYVLKQNTPVNYCITDISVSSNGGNDKEGYKYIANFNLVSNFCTEKMKCNFTMTKVGDTYKISQTDFLN